MAKPKKVPGQPAGLLVTPPPTASPLPGAVPLSEQTGRRTKKPLAAQEHPEARDSRGKASRAEIRNITHLDKAPRSSAKPAERSSQPRSHKAAKKK